ncbi:hypothetical protein C8Q79DRAFT_1119160 [Trametes meyenii]|nr:hypothetical protein C8Q79DRAFT_1119160 [Trametes meyenii]
MWVSNSSRIWTQEDQDQTDEKARRKAMDALVQSWMDRLQLISVITTFFAAMESQLLGSTMPDDPDDDPPIDQIANAALTGALVIHVFAAIISFLAAFSLIRYKLTVAKREERKVETGLADAATGRDATRGERAAGAATTSSGSSDVPLIFSSDPHLEQVGPFRRGQPPTHLLDHCHSLCMWMAAVGFVLALVGVLCFAWARLARSGGIFASVPPPQPPGPARPTPADRDGCHQPPVDDRPALPPFNASSSADTLPGSATRLLHAADHTPSAMLSPSRRSLLRRVRDAFFARWGLLDWLRIFWCAVVFWYERASFYWALAPCSWPDSALPPHQQRPAHVLLLADPQVRDLSVSTRVGFSAFRQFLVDQALKRNWHFASRTRPDVVVFLGDILASWRLIRSDEEYERNLLKFKSIFRLDPAVTSLYVPGNNDVGLNIDPATARQVRQRFTTHFGPLNQQVSVHNHTLVILDAAGLVEEDYARAAYYVDYERWTSVPNGSVEFVRFLKDEVEKQPTVLLTHIPLYRPDTAPCGPFREKGNIHRGVGPGYQNTLGKKTSTFLLQTLKPSLVFSADDKDYCDYVHVPPKGVGAAEPQADSPATEPVREITVKAFSPSTEIQYPGFQLLSIGTPPQPNTPSLASTPCFFPDYSNIYTRRYTPLVLLTALTLVFLRLRKRRAAALPLHSRHSAFRKSLSIHSLPPDAPWLHTPHPPTPFSPDWSVDSPGFRPPHAQRSPRPSFSPTDEFPHGVRTPVPVPSPDPAPTPRAPQTKGGDANPALGAPATPTFRAATASTTHARTDSATQLGPSFNFNFNNSTPTPASLPVPVPVPVDHDEHDHDEFARGLHDPRRLSRAQRGFNGSGSGEDELGSAAFTLTFTLGGQRRRVSFGALVPGWAARLWGVGDARQDQRPRPRLRRTAAGAMGGKRALARRAALDLGYVAWPAVLLWAFFTWRLS